MAESRGRRRHSTSSTMILVTVTREDVLAGVGMRAPRRKLPGCGEVLVFAAFDHRAAVMTTFEDRQLVPASLTGELLRLDTDVAVMYLLGRLVSRRGFWTLTTIGLVWYLDRMDENLICFDAEGF